MVLAVVAMASAVPLAAQETSFSILVPAPQATAEEAVAAAAEAYGPADTRARPKCPVPREGEEIVVCAEQQEQSQFRVKSSGTLDPAGAGSRGGVPRAPDLEHKYPGAVVASGCFIPPCPPPMPKIIDLKAIPEAPPGSDAERAARGLAPVRVGEVEAGAATPPESASPAVGP